MKRKMKMSIGTVGVDSGQLILIDPCYLKRAEELKNAENWEEFCKLREMVNWKPMEYKSGVVFNTAHGDGGYEVMAELDEDGSITKIEVDFDEM